MDTVATKRSVEAIHDEAGTRGRFRTRYVADVAEMKLLLLVNELPLWLAALLVVAAAEIFSVGLLLLCRGVYGVSHLSLNNEVAGFKFAVVGLFYGVLLAFVVIAVWEDYRNTETAV
ncbi:MAG: bestrophin-like domain, partial [Vulcanimicrobiaceae bacterium]